jgi:hypothetical protein
MPTLRCSLLANFWAHDEGGTVKKVSGDSGVRLVPTPQWEKEMEALQESRQPFP